MKRHLENATSNSNILAISNGPIDSTTLSLVSRHYRNGFEVSDDVEQDQDFDGIEPTILQDIISVILLEDTALGLSLLLAHNHDQNEDFSDIFKSTSTTLSEGASGLGLYLASVRAALKQSSVVDSESGFSSVFRIPPGLLYCWCKTLMFQNELDDKLFAKALKQTESFNTK